MNLTASPLDTSRIRDFAADLSVGLGKVAAKFVEDAIVGIRRASSVNLTEVAAALDEPIAIHATQKRLSRNLARTDVNSIVSQRLLALAARRVRRDTPLYVHVRDLNKPHARKMQYLLADSSSDRAGYRICEVVASEPDSGRYTPIIAHLWSPHSPDYESDSREILSALRRVVTATKGRGIFQLHSSAYEHGMSNENLGEIERLRGIFEIEFADSVDWLCEGVERSITEIVASCDRPFGVTLYKMHEGGLEDFVLCDVGAVEVNPRVAPEVKHTLIVEGYDSPRIRDMPKKPRLYLTTLPLNPTRETLTTFVAAQAAALQVVGSNLQHKDSYQLGRFRVLTYDRMKTLVTLLQAVTFYDAAIDRSATIHELKATLHPRPGAHKRTFLVPGAL